MSLAQDLSSRSIRMEGSVARSLPAERPQPRPAAAPNPKRRKVARRAMLVSVTAWVCAMALATILVRTSSAVLAETRAITAVREELTRTLEQNQQLESRLIESVSVAEVEKWALDHGMKRPVTIKQVQADPLAVAQRPSVAEVPTVAEPTGFWASVAGYFGRLTGGLGAAKP